jgi:3,4-dihydroxy 2-butanone 4-phosphate synthase / GTP cyclohydrolase II
MASPSLRDEVADAQFKLHAIHPDASAALAARQPGRGAVGSEAKKHPLWGTTLYVGTTWDLDTEFGPFDAHVYQDVSSKGYIVALTHGEVQKADEIATRVHSCCVTSETLGARDCDCVQQLNGALKRIKDFGAGILFFLYGSSQEGRGASYCCKARDRMFVQLAREGINTYTIYRTMGLKPDYRRYDYVKDISTMLGLHDPKWVLLTNNPDKINAFHELGLIVARTEKIDSRPTKFNIAYLRSKKKYGHALPQATADRSVYDAEGISLVIPFTPHALKDAPRFVHIASYYLPIGIIDGYMLLSTADRDTLVAGGVKLIKQTALRGRWWIQMDESTAPPEEAADDEEEEEGDAAAAASSVSKERAARIRVRNAARVLERVAYWFRVNVYYDLVAAEEFVVLEYGDPGSNLDVGQPPPLRSATEAEAADSVFHIPVAGDVSAFADSEDTGPVPMIRFHSESVFNRFPVLDPVYRRRYRRSILEIVKNGWGILSLFFHDGRGRGLGSIFVDQAEKGSVEDSRDFEAAAWVLMRHLRGAKQVKVLSTREHITIARGLKLHGVSIKEWVFVGDALLDHGHGVLRSRIEDIPTRVRETLEMPVPPFPNASYGEMAHADWVIAGTGSSESHARYMVSLLRRHSVCSAQFAPFTAFLDESSFFESDAPRVEVCDSPLLGGITGSAREDALRVLVVMSQGLSPNSWAALRRMNSFDRVIVFTAVTEANHSAAKQEWLSKVRAHPGGGMVVNFPMEDEYKILVRVVGPICGYVRVYQCVRSWCAVDLPDPALILPAVDAAHTVVIPRAVRETLIDSAKIMAGTTPAEASRSESESTTNDEVGLASPLAMALSRPAAFSGAGPRKTAIRDAEILSSPPLCDYTLNLAKKFEEGMLLVTPNQSDFLSFPHGRHQLLMLQHKRATLSGDVHPPAIVLMLDSSRGTDARIVSLCKTMTVGTLPTWHLASALPVDLQIIEFEAVINWLMLRVVEEANIDQCHWPGHDRESPLYHVNG